MAMVILSSVIAEQDRLLDEQVAQWRKGEAQQAGTPNDAAEERRGLATTRGVGSDDMIGGGAAAVGGGDGSGGGGGDSGGEPESSGLPSGITAQDKSGNTALHIVVSQATDSAISITEVRQ